MCCKMMMLNSEQQQAIDLVREGKHVFISGSAGVGKSVCLKHIIQISRNEGKNVGVTASTGLAAYLLRGRTIHSFLGIGLGDKSAPVLAESVKKKNRMLVKKLQELDMLIVDEVSMISDELLDKISEYLQLIRKCNLPFGGVQMILCGDFCQLPPLNGGFAFESKIWKTCGIKIIILKNLMRQADDPVFQKILEELRWGTCSKETLQLLKATAKNKFSQEIIPTKLYSVNADVDKININEYKKLEKLGAKTKTYPTTYSINAAAQTWANSLKIPTQVDLINGAQVYVSCNLQGDIGLVNGTRAVIVDLLDNGVKIKLASGMEVLIEYTKISSEDNDKIYVVFMPLKLAYSVTIHKSQGTTLDAVEMDLGDSVFEYGQAYVALSRAKSLQSVRIVSVKSKSFKTHPKVVAFYKNII